MDNDSKLKMIRLKELKMSQDQLAALAGLNRGTISSIEKGKDVRELTLSKLTEALSEKLGREIKNSDVY